MAELRWHPLIQDWVMINSNRQNRPQMPKDWCPFCPGSGKVPDDYEVLKYDNDFPALSQNPPQPDDVANDFFKVRPSYGKCEVILYSPGHHTTLKELSDEHMRKLVDLWAERYADISKDENIKYVFIFENRGSMVGTSMPHPHGQIYGYSVIPKSCSLNFSLRRNTARKKETVCSAICSKQNRILSNESYLKTIPSPFSSHSLPSIHTASMFSQNVTSPISPR